MATISGLKRSHSSSLADLHAPKKQKVHRALRKVQPSPQDVEPASQDPIFAQGQLLRSIASALVIAGFDSVRPSALEMFRSHVEEYMLQFLSYTRASMQNGRRTSPTAQDFATALAQVPNTANASQLRPQLKLSLPDDISRPYIQAPDLAPPPAVDLGNLLRPLMPANPPAYIPKHFPPLPPQHAWIETPVFPEREQDARKMRERATEEGTLAEHALRKLAVAAKSGAVKMERRRGEALSGTGKVRDKAGLHRTRPREDAFVDALRDLDDPSDSFGVDGAADAEDVVNFESAGGMLVNHDMGHWRKGSTGRTW